MNEQDRHNLFSQLIARHRNELYAYIYAVVRNWEDTDDLYQSTCLILWRKFDSFQPGSSFFAWARQTAKLEARSFLRRKNSSNYVREELLDALVDIALDAREEHAELYATALQRCKETLGAADQELLRLRYVENLGTREIAEQLQRLQPNVCKSLNRIRRRLLECIRLELVREERSEGDVS